DLTGFKNLSGLIRSLLFYFIPSRRWFFDIIFLNSYLLYFMLKQIKLSNFRSFSNTQVLNYIYIGRLRNWITNKGGFDNLVYNGIQENESISLRFFFDAQSSNVYDLSH
ncbi:hypothetical protein, partial [Candidatus Marithrix sp. Canyon 246]|uniref:hypothetical protein n=2 Tax=Candidatus Marithrix sp. Canyon 246 TaxID=1827136 RepID=UPI001C0BBAA3